MRARESARPILLLLPGLLCDRAAWAPVLPRLADGADCRIPDMPAESTLGEMADRVLEGAPQAFALAGHSMGGRVALEVVRKAPARVERIALLDTGYRSRPDGSAGERERQGRLAMLSLARDRGMREMGREWMRAMVHPSRHADTALADAILEMIERQTPERYASQIDALLARPDASDVLRSIDVPALVACGRDDAWTPLAQHREIAALIPRSRLAIWDDCGHMAPMEQPGPVADALVDWLRMPSQPRDARVSAAAAG
jgi:pimeloyl-ACP methyl ester carboxylesterase